MIDREKFDQMAEVTAAFATGLRELGTAAWTAGRKMALIFATPKERRRMERDWSRMDRKPTLIHNGRKP